MPLVEYVAPDGTHHAAFVLGFAGDRVVIAWADTRKIQWEYVDNFVERYTLAQTTETVLIEPVIR